MSQVNNKVAANDNDTVLDAASVENMKQMLLQQAQQEIDLLNQNISNIRFSMSQLEKQLGEKQKILDNRLEKQMMIQNTTLESLLGK
jgi:hypothetical protein